MILVDFMELFLTFIAGMFILIGTLITFKVNSDKFVDYTISTAFVVMLFLIIFEFVPEVFEELNIFISILCILTGLVFLKVLDIVFPHHHHDHKHDKGHSETLNHIAIVSSIALCLHNIVEGAAIYSTSLNSLSTGLIMVIGVGVHNIPMGMVIASSMHKDNKGKMFISLMVSLSTLLGGIIMMLFNIKHQTIFIAITLGMIIYIALFELLPKLICSKNKKEILYGFITGLVIVALSLLLHHH